MLSQTKRRSRSFKNHAQTLEGFDFPVQIVRTERKMSASLQVREQELRVLVPKTLSDQRVREIIVKRTPWITKKLQEALERSNQRRQSITDGAVLFYLGEPQQVKISVSAEPSVALKVGFIQVMFPDLGASKMVNDLVKSWYQKQASNYLDEKTKAFSKIIGVTPKTVRVKDYKSRWGACSMYGDITYNWRLMLAPPSIIDYVVVHELCHILEHNHSKRFWKHVERHIPDYRARRAWLKRNLYEPDIPQF